MALLEPGIDLGGYTILSKLATGGMAEVYLARRSGGAGFSKILVLKVILDELAADPQFVGMFRNEAKLAALLNHPNVVQVFDFGEERGTCFMAMEYIDGMGLHRVLRASMARGVRAFPVPIALRVTSDTCGALEYAHRLTDAEGNPHHIVHRDVSLENVLLTYGGQIKLVDFGLAKARSVQSYTTAGQIRGKLRYIAPEAIAGQPLDHRIDIFAMGVVLYRLLLGKMPFEGESHGSLFNSIMHKPPPDPQRLVRSFPGELRRIILRALEKDRSRRYQSAGEMQDDVERYLASGPAVLPSHLAQFMLHQFPPGTDEQHEAYQRLVGAAAPALPAAPPPWEMDAIETQIVDSAVETGAATEIADDPTADAAATGVLEMQADDAAETRTHPRSAQEAIATQIVDEPPMREAPTRAERPLRPWEVETQIEEAGAPSGHLPARGGEHPALGAAPTLDDLDVRPSGPRPVLHQAPTLIVRGHPLPGAPPLQAPTSGEVLFPGAAVEPVLPATGRRGWVLPLAFFIGAALVAGTLWGIYLAGDAEPPGAPAAGVDPRAAAAAGVSAARPDGSSPAAKVALRADAAQLVAPRRDAAARAATEADAKPSAAARVDAARPAAARVDAVDGMTVTKLRRPLRPPVRPTTAPSPGPARGGSLRILVRPWATVVLDGKPLGSTPMPAFSVREGPHWLLLENSALKASKLMRVQVRAGQETVVKVHLDR